MSVIDLNCDMGESFGAWTLGADDLLVPLVSSVNVACGFHAGDPTVIERTVRLALQHDVAIGAHPSYPDLQGFGRRSMKVTPDELESLALYQIAALDGIARACGGALHHVKLHGALYNDAAESAELTSAAARAIQRLNPQLCFYALSGSVMATVARDAGLHVVEEAFADRAYNPDGTLQSRALQGALIADPERAAQQAMSIAVSSQVETTQGQIPVRAGTLCLHGDNPSAVEIARAVRARLAEAGVDVRCPA